MNAKQRIAAYGAGAAFGLALTLNAALAQDPADTTPMAGQEPVQKTQPKAKAPARNELNTSIAKLTKFEDFDKNKDGSIAKEEIPLNDQLAVNFSSYDSNGDSKLSKEEFAKYNGTSRQVASNKAPKAKKQSESKQQ